ncbi:MAG: Stp1/IreP family PP2C-type Ser/Thr phosphatase [Eubacteriaceae bacterium]|jgi:protein phosphatase|nr:Stp1/IreP family PP2C-type Ser/Thr phosphatase [Eubacteriaceae bacterium]
MLAIGKTHIGRQRSINQDCFTCLNAEHYSVMAVADGMGGHNAGEVASKIAADDIEGYFRDKPDADFFEKPNEIEDLILSINKKIHEEAEFSESYAGMGTTLTLCVANGVVANVYHIGDSRAYIINDSLTQITKDHSLVQFLIDQGQLTRQEAENHPRRNVITRALGTDEEIQVDCFHIVLEKGDRLLLCSDGLSNMVKSKDILRIARSQPLAEAVESLVDLANENGGTDNITVVLAEMEETQ